MARSVKAILDGTISRLGSSTAPTAKKALAAVKRATAVYDSLTTVRDPILAQAATEQRNEAWSQSAINKAFGEKLGELARIQHEVGHLRSAHRASAPKLPSVDRTDVFAALESIEIAKRVAQIPPDQHHKLSPAEKLAALRSPTLAKLSPSETDMWTADIIKATQPDRIAAYVDGDAVLDAVDETLMIVKQSLQVVTGMVDTQSGVPTSNWHSFEREHLAPIHAELAEADKAAAAKRKAEAEAQNVEALAAAVKAMPIEARRNFIDKALDLQLEAVKAA